MLQCRETGSAEEVIGSCMAVPEQQLLHGMR